MAIRLKGDKLGSSLVDDIINVEHNTVAIKTELDVSGTMNLNADLNITGNINIAGALNYTEVNQTETNLFIEDKTIMVASASHTDATKAIQTGLVTYSVLVHLVKVLQGFYMTTL